MYSVVLLFCICCVATLLRTYVKWKLVYVKWIFIGVSIQNLAFPCALCVCRTCTGCQWDWTGCESVAHEALWRYPGYRRGPTRVPSRISFYRYLYAYHPRRYCCPLQRAAAVVAKESPLLTWHSRKPFSFQARRKGRIFFPIHKKCFLVFE